MQVFGQPPENSLDVAIVIPSYAEGREILHTLSSIACQENPENLSIGVFVVVNNARGAVEKVLKSNEDTMELVLQLQADIMPQGLDTRNRFMLHSPMPVSKIGPSQVRAAEAVMTSNMKLTMIDLSSVEYAPEDCNVGLARDSGMQQALKATKENAILISTDADTLMSNGYVKNAYSLLANQAEYSAATGPVWMFAYLDQSPEYIRGQTVHRAEMLIGSIMGTWARNNLIVSIGSNRFRVLAGSNTAIKREEYIAAGGYEHINGAEDAKLGLSLLRQGKKLMFSDQLSIETDLRESNRTDSNCGMGQHIIQKNEQHDEDGMHFKVKNPRSYIVGVMLEGAINAANRRDLPEREWKEAVQNYMAPESFGYVPLTDEDLKELWNLKECEPALTQVEKNHFLEKYMYALAESKWPLIPIDECLEFLEEILRKDMSKDALTSGIGEYYEKLKDFMQTEEEFCKRIRRENLHYPAGKNDGEGLTPDEMRTLMGIPHTREEEQRMSTMLSLDTLWNVVHVFDNERLGDEWVAEIQRARESKIITNIESSTLEQYMKKVPDLRQKIELLYSIIFQLGPQTLLFSEYLPRAEVATKKVAARIEEILIAAEEPFIDMKWDLSDLVAILKRLEEIDPENKNTEKIKKIIKEILSLYKSIDNGMRHSREIKFRHNKRPSQVLAKIFEWFMH